MQVSDFDFDLPDDRIKNIYCLPWFFCKLSESLVCRGFREFLYLVSHQCHKSIKPPKCHNSVTDWAGSLALSLLQIFTFLNKKCSKSAKVWVWWGVKILGPVLGFEIIDMRWSDMIFSLKLTLVLTTKVIFCEYVSWVTIIVWPWLLCSDCLFSRLVSDLKGHL